MKNGLIGVCGMVFSAVSVPVIAQSISQPSDSNPRLVTIVLKPTFTNRGLVAVYRRTPGVTGRDIIALKRSAATPELLVTVLGGLSRSREKFGDVPNRTITGYFSGNMRGMPISDSERQLASAVLGQLFAATPRNVPPIGNVPAVTIPFTR